MKDYEKMITCTCYTDGIMVRRFDDYEKYPLTYISFWAMAGSRFSFRSRLRFAWNMLRWGVSADEVVFDKEACKELAETLQDGIS